MHGYGWLENEGKYRLMIICVNVELVAAHSGDGKLRNVR